MKAENKTDLTMLPRSAWPVSPYNRRLHPGPRPQLEQERRDAIAEMDTITAAPQGARCMAIIGYGRRPTEEQWAVLRWSGSPPTEVLCRKKATVNIGCNFCEEHGAEHLAERMRHQLRNAYQDWSWETRERLVGHPLIDRWEDWERDGLALCEQDDDGEWKRCGSTERRTYVRAGLGPDLFGAHLRELGYRVVEPLWGLFEDDEPDVESMAS